MVLAYGAEEALPLTGTGTGTGDAGAAYLAPCSVYDNCIKYELIAGCCHLANKTEA